MKVLIIGGYGFIGSHTAERFSKEGHEVTVIDNLSSKNPRVPEIKHRHYKLDARSWGCGSFIKNGGFDIAIFLACKEITNGDTEGFNYNVNMLSNILELCARYQIKKFVFLSSTSVYPKKNGLYDEETKPQPSDMQGVNFAVMEECCQLWRGNSKMKVIILRTSTIYGPEQDLSKGLISEILTASKNEIIKLSRDKCYHFLYIGDVVDAIYRSSDDVSEGIVNTSADGFISGDELASYVTDGVRVEYIADKTTKNESLLYDNSLAKEKLEWVPLFDFKQGFEKTLRWYYDRNEQKIIKENKNKFRKLFSKRPDTIPILENIALFAIVAFFTLLSATGVSPLSVDFRILYIIVVGVFFGTRQSMLAAALSCLLLIFERMFIGVPLKSVIYDLNVMLMNVQYLIIGVSVGYMVERKNAQIDIKDNEIAHLKEDYDYLYMLYDETRKINAEFEERLLQYGDSYGRLFSIVSELDTLSPEKILFSTFDVLEQILNVKRASIYLANKSGTYLRRAAASNGAGGFLPRSTRLDDFPQWKMIINSREIYKNDSLNPSMPSMAAPIIFNERVIALVLIENMDFEKLTLYYYNLFKVVVSLVSSAITKAYLYEQAIIENSYHIGTMIMKEEQFRKLFIIRQEAASNHLSEFTILYVEDSFDFETCKLKSKMIAEKIRENDYIGFWEDGKMYVLLSNTSEKDAEFVIERLLKVGVKTRLTRLYIYE